MEVPTLASNQLVPINVKEQEFQKIMRIYEMAMVQVRDDLEDIKDNLSNNYQYDVINNINCRIKTPDSIIKKMKRKQYDLNYKNLIENVDDIAGIRVVCPFKSDIPKVVEILEENPNLEILQKKDYITKPKKSGYSGYHIIAQTPVNIGDAFANVKTEIQIKTMAMDFWSSTEHKLKYKAKNKLSKSDSKKMVKYAKIINKMDNEIMKIHKKYEKD
ncbi:MAG: GTP pyrophosphokinase family protein [Clostridia bacterium]|nr:GTP pyrophosphokinase family protein [Clostridia bacterium]